MTILALDIGEKRIGIAVSESGVIAQELTTIENNDRVIPFLIDLIKQRKVAKIVVGLPYFKSGDITLQAKKIKGFVVELVEKYSIPIAYEDEILTSREAERLLHEQGLGSEQIKARVDQMSAKIILEQYLSHQ